MSKDDEGDQAVNIDTAHDYNDNIDTKETEHAERILKKEPESDISKHTNMTKTKSTSPQMVLNNFLLFSLFFSLNHGGVVSCLSLATARLGGELGSYQSSVLYGSYTLSALFGATYAVKQLGGAGKGAVVLGMWLYCVYAACFILAAFMEHGSDNDDDGGKERWTVRETLVILGGLLGGIGGGFLWTAQGTYFARAAAEYVEASERRGKDGGIGGGMIGNFYVVSMKDAAKVLGGWFAAIYLSGELFMRLLSTVVVTILKLSWVDIFIVYTVVGVVSALFMSTMVISYPDKNIEGDDHTSVFHKITSTWRLFWTDYRMKYMVPTCGLFALSSSFLTSFVNGEVLILALNDTSSVYVGVFGSISSATAAIASILFAYLAQKTGNSLVLVLGCLAFAMTSFLFMVKPTIEGWGVGGLTIVYMLQGIGRATFEGSLRAEFAVIFTHNREGAFGNIVFWNGLLSVVGFLLTATVRCPEVGTYCIWYKDGSLHDVLLYEILVLVVALLSVGGICRVAYLQKVEREDEKRLSHEYAKELVLS